MKVVLRRYRNSGYKPSDDASIGCTVPTEREEFVGEALAFGEGADDESYGGRRLHHQKTKVVFSGRRSFGASEGICLRTFGG